MHIKGYSFNVEYARALSISVGGREVARRELHGGKNVVSDRDVTYQGTNFELTINSTTDHVYLYAMELTLCCEVSLSTVTQPTTDFTLASTTTELPPPPDCRLFNETILQIVPGLPVHSVGITRFSTVCDVSKLGVVRSVCNGSCESIGMGGLRMQPTGVQRAVESSGRDECKCCKGVGEYWQSFGNVTCGGRNYTVSTVMYRSCECHICSTRVGSNE
jgi:hypothetical protein